MQVGDRLAVNVRAEQPGYRAGWYDVGKMPEATDTLPLEDAVFNAVKAAFG